MSRTWTRAPYAPDVTTDHRGVPHDATGATVPHPPMLPYRQCHRCHAPFRATGAHVDMCFHCQTIAERRAYRRTEGRVSA